ncbi:MAG: pyridoxamine 5'-phosphate oxidase family protein [Tannerellaceae bacterium]|jgi:nitroimidazol reductase NimA-like FMN-containing flavoprotein (pyridoxamine 5'-phosphate oxidase superfamily)|nr:pyridoxamine 5'-phosphate oxidase family protein [Tannerellaceae bacterium]
MKTIIHTDRERIEDAINACDVCFVGMADTDGTPYVLPMNFGYLDGTVYLHSAQEGRKIDILERNPNVCITFCSAYKLVSQHPDVACSYSMHFTSVVGWGKVVYEDDFDKKTEILNIFMKHYSDKTFRYGAPAVRNVKIWKVPLENVTCKEKGN